MAYLGTMSQKTLLRLKRTDPKLLICHGCRKELQVGDEVIWAAGAQRKKYHKACADRYNIVYDDKPPAKPTEEDYLNTSQVEI
jgi:hypothetical protein